MAPVSGGPLGGSGGGGESSIPAIATPGAILGYDETGSLVASVTLDAKVNSVIAEDSASAGSVNSAALYVQNAGATAGVTADETGVRVADTISGTELFYGDDGIIADSTKATIAHVKALADANPTAEDGLAKASDISAVALTADQKAGVDAATGMDATHPPILEGDSRLTDTRDPMAHGENAHIGMVSTATQTRITPADYTGNLAGITGEDASVKDALAVIDDMSTGDPVNATTVAAAGAVMDSDFGSNGLMNRTGSGAYDVKSIGTGAGTVAAGDHTHTGMLTSPDGLTPGGRLYVPPAYMQTSGDTAVPLTSGTHRVALAFTPEVDFALDAVSFYVTAVGIAGNVSLGLHADAPAIEPNGALNGSYINAAPAMTANNAPGPAAVGLWDSAGTNAEVSGFEAFRAMDGSRASNNGVRSNAAPTAAAPVYYTLDFGAGNARVINRFQFCPFSNSDVNVRSYPRAWTFWGSNFDNPSVNSDTDWTQISGASPWTAEADIGSVTLSAFADYPVTNGTAYRHYRWKFTDRNGANAYVSLGEIRLYEAQTESAPGPLVHALGTTAVGWSADAWVRHTFDACPLQRGIKRWLVFTGTDATDFSLSLRRNTAVAGSMFPDGCTVKQTADGNVWTRSQQDNRPAMLNAVLNSTANHCPQLVYGRCSGTYVHVYTGDAWSAAIIPEQGIKLGCESLSASTRYNVYLYDMSGNLALEATTDDRTLQDGIEVKSGAAFARFVGLIAVDTLQPGFQGPLDVPDARLVRNRFNPACKELTKDPNYIAYTRADHFGNAFARLNNNDDFKMRIVSWGVETVTFAVSLYMGSGYAWAIGFAADGACPKDDDLFAPNTGGTVGGLTCITAGVALTEGCHALWPVIGADAANQLNQVYLTSNQAPYRKSICLSASVWC